MRISELISLPLSDFIQINDLLQIKGKGGSYRQVAFNNKAKKVIEKWLLYRSKIEIFSNNKYMFPNNNGKGYTIKYYKGLGTSNRKEAQEYFQNLKKITFNISTLIEIEGYF